MNKVVRDILVEDLREALTESKQREESMRSEIDELRYNLWMCRKCLSIIYGYSRRFA